MAKRKRKKSKPKKVSFTFAGSKRKIKKKSKTGRRRLNLTAVFKVSAVVCVFAAVVLGFVLMSRYVRKAVPISAKTASVELVDTPAWVNEPLKERIYIAARAEGQDLKIDEDAARSVQRNIESRIAWLDEVKVQTTGDSIHIEGRWRRPLALVKRGFESFYVDADLVVLDFVPKLALPIVRIVGLSAGAKMPRPGEVCQWEDMGAAVAILALLEQRDRLVTSGKGLLYEIDRIDVSNFNGRQNSRLPHIILYAKDNTEITWGAEVGSWQRYLEATDQQKIAKLYGYYKKHGSLLNSVKYINLRDPQDDVPLPIDKY